MIMGHSEQIAPKKTHDHEGAGWRGVQSHPARGKAGALTPQHRIRKMV
jgi:hypothetical protein